MKMNSRSISLRQTEFPEKLIDRYLLEEDEKSEEEYNRRILNTLYTCHGGSLTEKISIMEFVKLCKNTHIYPDLITFNCLISVCMQLFRGTSMVGSSCDLQTLLTGSKGNISFRQFEYALKILSKEVFSGERSPNVQFTLLLAYISPHISAKYNLSFLIPKKYRSYLKMKEINQVRTCFITPYLNTSRSSKQNESTRMPKSSSILQKNLKNKYSGNAISNKQRLKATNIRKKCLESQCISERGLESLECSEISEMFNKAHIQGNQGRGMVVSNMGSNNMGSNNMVSNNTGSNTTTHTSTHKEEMQNSNNCNCLEDPQDAETGGSASVSGLIGITTGPAGFRRSTAYKSRSREKLGRSNYVSLGNNKWNDHISSRGGPDTNPSALSVTGNAFTTIDASYANLPSLSERPPHKNRHITLTLGNIYEGEIDEAREIQVHSSLTTFSDRLKLSNKKDSSTSSTNYSAYKRVGEERIFTGASRSQTRKNRFDENELEVSMKTKSHSLQPMGGGGLSAMNTINTNAPITGPITPNSQHNNLNSIRKLNSIRNKQYLLSATTQKTGNQRDTFSYTSGLSTHHSSIEAEPSKPSFPQQNDYENKQFPLQFLKGVITLFLEGFK